MMLSRKLKRNVSQARLLALMDPKYRGRGLRDPNYEGLSIEEAIKELQRRYYPKSTLDELRAAYSPKTGFRVVTGMEGRSHGEILERWRKIRYSVERLSKIKRKEMTERNQDQVFRAALTEKVKSLYKDPGYRAAASERGKEQWKYHEDRATASEIRKQPWKDPGYRAAASERMKERWKDPDFAATVSEGLKERWKDPGYAAAIARASSEVMKERLKDPDFVAAISEKMKGRWQDPDFAAAISERMKRLNKDPTVKQNQINGYERYLEAKGFFSRRRLLEERIDSHYRELNGDVLRYFAKYFRNTASAEAEELRQETFLRLYKALRRDETIMNVRDWVFKVAHNLMVDHIVHHRALMRDIAKTSAMPENEYEIHISDPSPTQEQQLIAAERRQMVQTALNALPEKQRLGFELRMQGLGLKEIGGILGMSISGVEDIIKRTTAKLKITINATLTRSAETTISDTGLRV